jgi:peptide/nickel transport system ATP-binding protein
VARVAKRLLGLGRRECAARVARLLDEVRLPAGIAESRPRQLSGGQKQRIAIARAFIGEPAIVVADEPVAALDVSVRAAVIEVLMQAQRTRGTTLILISHDLALVRYVADSVVVMYMGRVMESGTVEQVFAPPHHPYTAALLAGAAAARRGGRRAARAGGGDRAAERAQADRGCPFQARCPRKLGAVCETERPPEREAADGHRIACHIPLAELAHADAPRPRVDA